MSQIEKAIKRLIQQPKDFTYGELRKIMTSYRFF